MNKITFGLITFLFLSFSTFAQISGTTNVCGGQTETYTTSINANSYIWNVTGAKSTNPVGSSITVEWNNAGAGNINLSALDVNNNSIGSGALSVAITAKPNPVILSSFSTTCFENQEPKDSCFTACQLQPTVYSSPFLSGATYTWELIGDGSFTNISTNEIEVIWQTIGQNFIKLTVANGAGCSNIFEKCVTVIEAPDAIIDTEQFLFVPLYPSSDTIRVCRGSSFFLEDQSTGAINRRWDFGDGTFSDQINPEHSYSQGGTYQVILTASNACFCTDKDTMTIIVDNGESANLECISTICAGDTTEYNALTDCTESQWILYGGTFAGNPGPSQDNMLLNVVWNQHPSFLQYNSRDCPSGCLESVTEKIPVLVDSIPIEGASSACIGDINVYSVEPIPGSEYFWSVDLSKVTILEDNGHSITVEHKDVGSFNMTLFYVNGVLGCSGVTGMSVVARRRLNFAMPQEVCQNEISQFTVDFDVKWQILNSSGQLVFNDNRATQVSIDWSNFNSGDYTMRLLKLNSYCNDLELPFTINPAPDAPDSIFGQAAVCVASAYSYSVDPKSGHRVEWEVTGGNPASATGNTITVNWNNNGPYLVKAAYRSLESPHCLSIFEEKIVEPLFTGTQAIVVPDSACGGDTTAVNLNFMADNVQWTVTPSDGASIVTDRFLNQITVQYSASKSQDIVLRANGMMCGVPFNLQKTIYVQSFPAPTINFSDPNPCPNNPVTFSTNAINPTWMIDGVTTNASSPTLSFDSARSVLTQVTANYVGPMGCTAQRVNVEQLIVKVAPKAILSVIDTNNNHCGDTLYPVGISASLQGSNSANYSYQWLRNDTFLFQATGNSYNTPAISPHGRYRVQITAPNGCVSTSDEFRIDHCTSSDGCIDISRRPNVRVEVILDSTSCSDFFVGTVNVTGGYNLVDLRLRNPHIATNNVGPQGLGFSLPAGAHTLHFSGSVVLGSDTLCFDINREKTINVSPDFKIIKQPCITTGLTRYEFVNTSTYATANLPQFNWNFGSNAIVVNNGFNKTVDFLTGMHTITLTAAGTNCSVTKQLTVDAPTVASFVTSAPSCQQEPVQFTNLSSGNIIEYKWDLGGQVLFQENPTATFVGANNVFTADFDPVIELSILGSDGCRDTIDQQISIRGNLFDGLIGALGGFSTFCEGDSSTLAFSQNPLSTPNTNTPISYNWSNGEISSIIRAKQTGNYQLNMVDNVGCRFVTNQLNIQANTIPKPTIIGKQSFCADERVKLSVLNHPSYTLNWTVDSVSAGITGENFSMALGVGNHSVNINAQNTNNTCSSNNAPFPVTVLTAIPKPSITTSGTNSLCEGSPITLTASPAGGNFFWSTGQTGNSITQSLAGRYTVIQTDASGCQASNFIDINPLPDFTNFMTGCYCLPSQPPVSLLGIPNMASYQWVKDGVNVSGGIQKDIIASEGMFELIAVSDSGCVDTSGTVSISIGDCNPCATTLTNLMVNCTRIDGDSAFYDFSFNADINNTPSLYDITANVRIEASPRQPAILQQLQPSQISGNGNIITGSFILVDSIASTGNVCISLVALNPAGNCVNEICTILEPVVCEIDASYTSNFDKTNCMLTLTSRSRVDDDCIAIDKDSIRWEVTYQGNTYVQYGEEVTFLNMRNDVARVCMTVSASDFSGNITCQEQVCDEIRLPNCICREECQETFVSNANFDSFESRNDSCIIRFMVEITDASGNPFDLSSLFTTNGTVIGSHLVGANNGTQAYSIDFYPNREWRGGEACFEFFIQLESGEICCLTFCLELPPCNLRRREKSPLSLNSAIEEGTFITYPNPAKQVIFIEWNEYLDESIELIVLDQNSKTVYSQAKTVQGNRIELNVDNLSEGVYVLEIRRKEGTSQQKIVILR